MIVGKQNWNKYESLEYLKSKNYNTPDFRLIKNTEELLRAVDEWGRDSKLSIRSFRNNGSISFNEPFHPNVVMTVEMMEKLNGYFSDGYHLIMAKGIDPQGTLYKGNIMIYPSFSMRRFDFIIECTAGYGTVRDLETSKKVLRYTNLQDALNVMGYQIQKIFIATKDVFADMDKQPVILEWSIYDFPVGIRNKHAIYWEVRQGTNPCLLK